MGYVVPMAGKLARIAERAGVSEATVSRVLNDKPGVAQRTRGAVIAAMDVLGINVYDALNASTLVFSEDALRTAIEVLA